MKQPVPTRPNRLVGTTAIVTGAGRGFGRAIATAVTAAGAEVIGVARTRSELDQVHRALGDAFTPVVADAAEAATAVQLLERYRPSTLVLCAGAAPQMAPLQEQSWDSFSRNWNVDVAQAFHWIRAALALPLVPGSSVVAMSSGAALAGSPLSGGYAGAKATVRLIAEYAAAEADRDRLGIRFLSVLPRLTPVTELGAQAVAAYAARQGVAVDDFLAASGPVLSAEQVGRSVLEAVCLPAHGAGAYLLTSAGLSAVA